MIRFLLKTAFVIGIGSLFIPGLGSGDEDVTLDPFQSFVGLRAAVDDVMGFCARAPEACEAGAQIGQFALGRVESGISVALDAANSGGASDEATLKPGAADHRNRPAIDYSSIDPGLIRELLAISDEDLGTKQISPDLVKAVRNAAIQAARGEPIDQRTVSDIEPPAANAVLPPRGVLSAPIPRPRPGL